MFFSFKEAIVSLSSTLPHRKVCSCCRIARLLKTKVQTVHCTPNILFIYGLDVFVDLGVGTV